MQFCKIIWQASNSVAGPKFHEFLWNRRKPGALHMTSTQQSFWAAKFSFTTLHVTEIFLAYKTQKKNITLIPRGIYSTPCTLNSYVA